MRKSLKKDPLIQKNYIVSQNYEQLKEALSKYDAEKLENDSVTAEDIYIKYTYVDGVFTWLRNAYDDNLCVIGNEMRAVLGHLAEYDGTDDKKKENLPKAHNHLRRLSIDVLKILCNGLDQIFDEWMQKYAKYDFRKTDFDYFPKYAELYFKAHNEYLKVQKNERVGSDRGNKIIKQYLDVSNCYLELYNHHNQRRREKIEKSVNKLIIISKSSMFVTLILALISIASFFV